MTERILDRIDYEIDDAVARIELARPDAGNALDLQMCQALAEVGRRVTADAQPSSRLTPRRPAPARRPPSSTGSA